MKRKSATLAAAAMAAVAMAAMLGACTTVPGSTSTVASAGRAPQASSPRERAKAHTELASLYYQQGNMGVALDEVRIALASDGAYAPAYSMRGLVQMYLLENEAAEESFQRALRLAPGDPEINNNFGWFLCQTGRERQSLGYFLEAIKNPLYQSPEKSYTNAGICAMQLRDYRMAEDYLQKALRYGRNRSPALMHLANLRYVTGDYEDAREFLTSHHEQADPSAESLWLALRVSRKLKNEELEASYASQLRRRFPDSREVRELKRGNFE